MKGVTETEQIDFASASQKELFEYGPAPVLGSGGFGSSKTFGAALKVVYLSDLYPGFRTLVARRFYSELKHTTMATFFKIIPPSAYAKGKRNDQAGELILNNGSSILFLHLDKPEASTIIRGLEVNAVLLDQAEEIQEETYDMVDARLGRWDKATVPKWLVEQHEDETGKPWPWKTKDKRKCLPPNYMILTANPAIELHWLWRRFHPNSAEWKTKWRKLGYHMINFDSRDNKFLPQQNLDKLLSKGEDFQKRYVRGEWGTPEGVLFDVSPESIIDGTPEFVEYLTNTCALHRVLDHGYSAPTCCLWFAVDAEGNTFCYREYYEISDKISVHRANITGLSTRPNGHPEQYRSSIADSEIFNQMPQKYGGRWSVADEYRDVQMLPRHTAISWRPADKAEMASRHRLVEYLRVDPERKHPVSGKMGAPRLYFVKRTPAYPNGCEQAIIETRSARRLKVGSIDGRAIFSDERDPSIPDHALDPVRYHVLSRPAVAEIAKPVAPIESWEGYSQYTKQYRRLMGKRRDRDR